MDSGECSNGRSGLYEGRPGGYAALFTCLLLIFSLTGCGEEPAEQGSQAGRPAQARPAASANSPTETKLGETPETEKRNVVLIVLEATRARSVTPYNPDLETMPFLDDLSKKSLLAER